MAQMEDLFQDYKGRRTGIIKALTDGLSELLKESKAVQMNTPFTQRKCLWGLPDGNWELKHVQYQAAGQIPQPHPLIPFDQQWDKWVSRMADLSDAWLVSLAFDRSSHLSMDERKSLYEKISSMPSVKAVVTPDCPFELLLDMNEQPLEFGPEYLSRKSLPTSCMRRNCAFGNDSGISPQKKKDSGIDKWIECNICELWYHCECCELDEKKADVIPFYNCKSCLAKDGKGVAAEQARDREPVADGAGSSEQTPPTDASSGHR